MARPAAMISATTPSIRSVDLPLSGFRLPAGSCLTATFDTIQRMTGVAAMNQLAADDQSFKFLRWRRHGCKTLTERHHLDSIPVSCVHRCVAFPTVKRNFPDLELLTVFPNAFTDHVVVDDIAVSYLSLANY